MRSAAGLCCARESPGLACKSCVGLSVTCRPGAAPAPVPATRNGEPLRAQQAGFAFAAVTLRVWTRRRCKRAALPNSSRGCSVSAVPRTEGVETSSEVTLTRELVAGAVEEYGAAWVAQDPDRIARLFTENAVYIERVFDRAATFRGRRAIRKYWFRQIVGKQSNIVFRHVASDMIVDAPQGRATVKWLAEFDNIRFDSKSTPSDSKVRFVQVALLHFSPDRQQISYLEEYLQSAQKKRYNWPPFGILETPESKLGAMFRMEEDAFWSDPAVACVCDFCGMQFPSRNALFKHLKSGCRDGACGLEVDTEEFAASMAEYQPPSARKMPSKKNVAFTVTYSSKVGSGTGVWETIQRALEASFPSTPGQYAQVSWASDPSNAPAAAANVFTLRLPHEAETLLDEDIAARVNQALQATEAAVLIMWCTSVPLIMNAKRRLFFEHYEVLVPFDLLCNVAGADCTFSATSTDVSVVLTRRLKQPGEVDRVFGLLWAWIRGAVAPEAVERLLAAENRGNASLWPVAPVPSECVMLVAPRMDTCEMQLGRSLSGRWNATVVQKEVATKALSLLRAEAVQKEEKSGLLRDWAATVSLA